MIFPAPPIRTPFVIKNGEQEIISSDWIKWMQKISIQLTTSPTTVTGSRGGNAALASLLSVLASKGYITDGTIP